MGVVSAQIAFGRNDVDDVLIGQGRVIAGIKGDARPAGAMALGAVGVEVRAGALIQGGVEIGEGGEMGEVGDGGLVEGGIEQADVWLRARSWLSGWLMG
jgi:hypothetical protein